METVRRRYDIDWLRVIAIGLLLIYHIGIGFQPWGVFIGFIQSEKPLGILWTAMSMLNVWRIPLLFFVSGMGVCFAMQKRNWKQLLVERAKRILLPFLFGVFCIVPVHILMWQKYYHQDLAYTPNPSHLWFLANIFIYVLLLSPFLYYLKRKEDSRISGWLKRLFSMPAGFLFIAACFILEAMWVNPESFETYAMTWHGFVMGLLAFFFGFCLVYAGNFFWNSISSWKWVFLSVALVLYILRIEVFQLKAPYYLMALESCSWIFAAFGLSYAYLNRPGKTLHYLSQGAYPIYIMHMIFLYLGSFLIMPLSLPASWQFILIVLFTVAACIGFYDLIIRRLSFIRPLFGLK